MWLLSIHGIRCVPFFPQTRTPFQKESYFSSVCVIDPKVLNKYYFETFYPITLYAKLGFYCPSLAGENDSNVNILQRRWTNFYQKNKSLTRRWAKTQSSFVTLSLLDYVINCLLIPYAEFWFLLYLRVTKVCWVYPSKCKFLIFISSIWQMPFL